MSFKKPIMNAENKRTTAKPYVVGVVNYDNIGDCVISLLQDQADESSTRSNLRITTLAD